MFPPVSSRLPCSTLSCFWSNASSLSLWVTTTAVVVRLGQPWSLARLNAPQALPLTTGWWAAKKAMGREQQQHRQQVG